MSKEVEARKRIKKIKERLGDIETEAGKIEIPFHKISMKKGLHKLVNLIDMMLKGDVKEYKEVGKKKVGGLEIKQGLKIRFIGDRKKK